jgi:hypothetical protein
MSRITVKPLKPGHYGIAVTEGADTTDHEIVVDRRLVDDIGLSGYDDVLVAEEAFAFLLDRFPADDLGRHISLRDVDRMHPEFRDELVARVTARSHPE